MQRGLKKGQTVGVSKLNRCSTSPERPRTTHHACQRRTGYSPGIRHATGHHGAAPPHGLSAMCRVRGDRAPTRRRAAAAIAEVEALADEVMRWLESDRMTDGA